MMTNWRELIESALIAHGETWSDVEQLVCDDIDTKFDSGYGAEEGKAFTVWTKDWVYFPACYDGSEWVACVARKWKINEPCRRLNETR